MKHGWFPSFFQCICRKFLNDEMTWLSKSWQMYLCRVVVRKLNWSNWLKIWHKISQSKGCSYLPRKELTITFFSSSLYLCPIHKWKKAFAEEPTLDCVSILTSRTAFLYLNCAATSPTEWLSFCRALEVRAFRRRKHHYHNLELINSFWSI